MPQEGDVVLWEDRRIRLINRHQADHQIWVGEFLDGNHERRFLAEEAVADLAPIAVGASPPQATHPEPGPTQSRRRRGRAAPRAPTPQPVQPAAPGVPKTCPYCRAQYAGNLGTDHACATVERLRCPGCGAFDPLTAPTRPGRHARARLCQACIQRGKAVCHACGAIFEKGAAGSHCRACDQKPPVWVEHQAPIGGPVIVETRSHRPFGVEIESYRVSSQATAPREAIPNWVEATDASIHPPEDGDEEIDEIVEWRSPPYVGDAGLEALRRDVQKIRDMGFRCNGSTSVHIHLDAADTSPAERESLHRFGLWIEEDIFSFVAPSRRTVVYARPLAEQGRGGNARYKWLNIEPAFERHKTIEVRLHHGTTDADRVVEWAKVCLRIVERGLRLGTLAEKPNMDVFRLLDLTRYEKAYWSEVIEKFARRPA